jgi:hypothetical protein
MPVEAAGSGVLSERARLAYAARYRAGQTGMSPFGASAQ